MIAAMSRWNRHLSGSLMKVALHYTHHASLHHEGNVRSSVAEVAAECGQSEKWVLLARRELVALGILQELVPKRGNRIGVYAVDWSARISREDVANAA